MAIVKTFAAAVLKQLGAVRCSNSLPCSEAGVPLKCSDKGGFTAAP